jgi:hypothetical protein
MQAHGAAVTFPHCGTVPHPLLRTLIHLRAHGRTALTGTVQPWCKPGSASRRHPGTAGRTAGQSAAHEACSFSFANQPGRPSGRRRQPAWLARAGLNVAAKTWK